MAASSRDDEESQHNEAKAIAVGATPIHVIRDKRSKMIHADCVRCKRTEDEFPIETTAQVDFGIWVILKLPFELRLQNSYSCGNLMQHQRKGSEVIGLLR